MFSGQHATRTVAASAPGLRLAGGPPRGAVTTALLMLLVLCVLAAACVLNWNFLVLVNRNMQAKSDIIALAAAPALLDEDLLRDYPAAASPDQADDLDEACRVAERFRQENNRVGGQTLAIDAAELKVESGFVADISGQSPYRFERSPLPGPSRPAISHNTLRVSCARLAGGDRPVRPLLASIGPGTSSPAEVATGAYATLDNLVVGLRPTSTMAAPLMPLAIDALQWDLRSPAPAAIDTNKNRIREMILQLRRPEGPFDANAILIDFSGEAGAFDAGRLTSQIAGGVAAGEVLGGQIGPITGPQRSGDRYVTYRARQFASVGQGSLTERLAASLRAAIDAAEARGQTLARVFPLCRPLRDWTPAADGAVDVIGLVACNVLDAWADASHGARLQVLVEPTFVVHPTVWTEPPCYNAPHNPERNKYVHRLRLSH